MGARLASALAAVLGAGFLATLAAHAAGPETEGERPAVVERPPATATTVRAPPAADGAGLMVAPASTTAPPAKRARVAPGVLVRAASRRAQEREASSAPAPERRRAREEGNIISVEIDWHAGTPDR
jgi:hypothetical protein